MYDRINMKAAEYPVRTPLQEKWTIAGTYAAKQPFAYTRIYNTRKGIIIFVLQIQQHRDFQVTPWKSIRTVWELSFFLQ